MVSSAIFNKTAEADHWQEFVRPDGHHLQDRFTQKLPCFLRSLNDLPTSINSLLRAKPSILLAPKKLKANEGNSPLQQLRLIQVQAAFRVGMWAYAGKAFIEPFSRKIQERSMKKIKRSKKRSLTAQSKQDPLANVMDELISVLELAAFFLGPETSFASFLAQCITQPCYEKIPILRRVFQHFECPNPYVEEAPIPLRPLQKRRRPRLPPPQQQPVVEQQLPSKPKKEASFLKENRSFTAPVRRNALLQGKTRYVGSHFNSHLGSMETLFRAGALPAPKPIVTPKQPKRTKARGTKRVVPATPCAPPKAKKATSPAVGSLVAQAFQSIDQGNRRRRRK